MMTTGRRRKASSPPPTLDPVTQYATDVRDGRIAAGRAVRLACQRHLDDLGREKTPAFPYYFDAGAAQHIIDFFPEFLTLETGDPFILPPWLQFCYGALFGWKCWGGPRNDKRKYQVAYLETSKGSGKSPSAGGIGLYCLAFDGEPYAQVYSGAFDTEQASIILNDAIRMASESAELRELLTIGKYNIAHEASGSFFRAVSSEHRSKSGPRPSCVLSDELHEQRDGNVLGKLLAGFKNRSQPVGLLLTNSGSDKTSMCWHYHQKSLDVLEGVASDEQWFAYVCHLDPCEACYSEGFRQPKDGCPDCDDWTDPAVWPKVAPALGVVIQPHYMQTQVDIALTMPTERARVLRLNFCIWTETHQIWIPPEHWAACKRESVASANPEGRPCAAGMDLADVLDLAAVCVAVRFDDPPSADVPEVLAIEGMNADGERATINVTLNFSVDLIPFAWWPEETFHDRLQNRDVPADADVWRREGKLFVTPGPVIDHQAIYEFIAKDLWKRYKIQRLGYDKAGATMLATKLRDEARLGDAIIELPQAKRLSEANKLMRALVRTRRLRHDGHPVLAWCVSNAEPHEDRMGALWIEKASAKKRIDLAVAAIMAIQQVALLPAMRPRRRATVGVVTREGYRDLMTGGTDGPLASA